MNDRNVFVRAGFGLLSVAMLALPTITFVYVRTRVQIGDQGTGIQAPAMNPTAGSRYHEFADQQKPVLLVVGYHDLVARPMKRPEHPARGVSVAASSFAAQLRMLRHAGFAALTADQIVAHLNKGYSIPSHSVLITFDGSHVRDWIYADPILKKYGFQATVFVDPETLAVPGPSGLSWAHLQTMVASGRWCVGVGAAAAGDVFIDKAGTRGSSLLSQRWLGDKGRVESTGEFASRVRARLARARRLIRAQGLPAPVLFSYPLQAGYPIERVRQTFGELEAIVDELFSAGVLSTAPDQAAGMAWSARKILPRIEVYGTTTDEILFGRIWAATRTQG